MAITVSEVLDDFKLACAGSAWNGPELVGKLNRFHARICRAFPIDLQAYSINVVQGVSEYALPASLIALTYGSYAQDATASNSFRITDEPTQDTEFDGWRQNVQTGIPEGAMVVRRGGTRYLRLTFPPGATTVAGYPTIAVEGHRFIPLTESGTLPELITDPDCYVRFLCLEWAKIRERDQVPGLRAELDAAIAQLSMQVYGDSPTDTPAVLGIAYRTGAQAC